MIAANYKKHPQAMAMQLVLHFGRPVWQLPRPSTRILRAIRAARGVAFKLAGFIEYPTKPTTPQWFKDAAKRARQLAAQVKAALMPLAFPTMTEGQFSKAVRPFVQARIAAAKAEAGGYLTWMTTEKIRAEAYRYARANPHLFFPQPLKGASAMKCYIETKCFYDTASMEREWIAQIVTEQDYLFGGPHAHSYRTPRMPSVALAREAAEEIAGDMLLQVVPHKEITG